MNSNEIAARTARFDLIHIDNPREDAVHRVIEQMRAVGMATAGQPQKAVQFLCKSFTGKSTILKSMVSRTNAEAERGTVAIFYLELASSTTPNQLWEQMLVALGDGLGGKGRNEAQRFSRVCALLAQSGVTLIIFDEIQHLISHETARVAWRVTEAIKRLLNAGIAPIVLSGDLSADALFKRNPSCAIECVSRCSYRLSIMRTQMTPDTPRFSWIASTNTWSTPAS